MKPRLDNILLKVQDTVTRTVNYTVFLCKGKNFSALKQISLVKRLFHLSVPPLF